MVVLHHKKEYYCELIDGKHFYQQCAGKKAGPKVGKAKNGNGIG